jgi:DNA-binding NarL/FixJ family response regulator
MHRDVEGEQDGGAARPPQSGHSALLPQFGLDECVYEALRAGASGFMLKDSRPEELVAAVRVVAGGDALLVARILQKLGLRDRVQAVIFAYESGLVSPGANGAS